MHDGATSPVRSPPPPERRHPLRFVWRMDERGHFTLDSDEFIMLVGSRTAAALGRPWPELAADLGLDPDGLIARAVATRDTWSGLAIRWPVDGGPEPLAVELSGLPVLDRDRTYSGYRGFGVCRDLERLAALAERRRSAPGCATDVAPHAPSGGQPAPDHAPSAAAADGDNVVPFAAGAAEPAVPALSPVERSAFRELSRMLSQRLTAAGIEHESTAPAAGEDDPPEIASEGEPAHAPVTDPRLELAQAEIAELRSILDTATDGVILLDPQGSIVSANRGAEALFGYDELAGRPLAELLAPESAEVARADLAGLRRDDVASLLNSGREVTGRVRQGGPIPLFMTVGRIGDRSDKLCAVFRDMTPWKQVEQELVEARRAAERASSAKSDFLARISHEIRTPLNAIIGFSEVMMEQRFGPIGNERYRDYLKDIHASGGHLLSLINDLLDLSKIEAGKLELTFAGVALDDLVQQCVAIMQPQANRERIIIRTSLPAGLPQVVADARSVRQIVLNLLSNSIKFTGAGGQVIVSTARADDGGVILRVRDTGVGMSEKDLVTALEPFRQLATSPRGGSGGTGLGLPLTKALAEANRASFRIKSAPEEGTLVEIAFPPGQVLAG
jgi:PAS domain S-box-containing protein